MSRRNMLEAKRSRREERERREAVDRERRLGMVRQMSEAKKKANEEFEANLRSKLRTIVDTYNAKIVKSTVPELRAEAKRRIDLGHEINGRPHSMLKAQLVESLLMSDKDVELHVARSMAARS